MRQHYPYVPKEIYYYTAFFLITNTILQEEQEEDEEEDDQNPSGTVREADGTRDRGRDSPEKVDGTDTEAEIEIGGEEKEEQKMPNIRGSRYVETDSVLAFSELLLLFNEYSTSR